MLARNIPLTVGGVAVLACAFLVFASGCAVGRRETDGAIVLGFEAGKLAETPGQIAAAATSFLPEPFGGLAQVALGALGVGGAVAASGRKRSQQESDAAWTEGHAEGKAAAEAAAAAAARERDAAEQARIRRDRDRLLAAADPASVSRIVAGVVPTGPVPANGAGSGNV